jgi:hypothetical protein
MYDTLKKIAKITHFSFQYFASHKCKNVLSHRNFCSWSESKCEGFTFPLTFFLLLAKRRKKTEGTYPWEVKDQVSCDRSGGESGTSLLLVIHEIIVWKFRKSFYSGPLWSDFSLDSPHQYICMIGGEVLWQIVKKKHRREKWLASSQIYGLERQLSLRK